MHENFGVFRREEPDAGAGRDHRAACGSATSASSSRTRATVFNNDLTQALELGFLLELAECMVEPASARKESRGAHARPYDYPTATTRTT